MANIMFTGFHGITAAQLGRRGLTGVSWAGGTATVDAAANRWGGPAINMWSGYYFDIPVSATSLYFGINIKPHTNAIGDTEFLQIFAADGSSLIARLEWASGKIDVKNANNTSIGQSTTTCATGTDYYIEVGFDGIGASQTLSLRVNGAVEVTATTDTQPGSQTATGKVRLYGNNNNRVYFSDLYINDSTGSAPHNTFYGDIRVSAPLTVADSAVQFTPLSGSNESNIDDGATPDDATSYNSSGTVGHRDVFTISGYSGDNILGVAVRATVAKDDAGARTLSAVVKSGSSSLVGSALTLSTSYAEASVYAYVDPATSVAFANAAAVNALVVGYEVAG